MTATNKTKNYNLPQWVGTDNLSIMGDMNGAFSKVDEILKTFNEDIATAKATATGSSEISAGSSVTAQSALQKATDALNKATEALQNATTGKAYVGKIILSSTLDTMEKVISQFGGKRWSLIQDKFLIGAGGKYAGGVTGGEESHTLSVDELPSHKHDVVFMQNGHPRPSSLYHTNANFGTNYEAASYGGDSTAKVGEYTTSNTGGSKPISMLPPYIAVYIWTCQEI